MRRPRLFSFVFAFAALRARDSDKFEGLSRELCAHTPHAHTHFITLSHTHTRVVFSKKVHKYSEYTTHFFSV